MINKIRIKRLLKWMGGLLLIPVGYLVVSLLLTAISVNTTDNGTLRDRTIFLSTNGIHLNIILPLPLVDTSLLEGLNRAPDEQYLSFGWGDADFYLNTPEWKDLTLPTAVKALFFNSSSLVHLIRYTAEQEDWVAVPISKSELDKLQAYLNASFEQDAAGNKILLAGQGYSHNDDFYRGIGSYSCLKTCNTWANTGFKRSGLKASLWTPFDFGLLNKYR